MSKSTALQPVVTLETPNITIKPAPALRSSAAMTGRVARGGNQTIRPPAA